jgi:lipopolysaccharide heptosyltransferase II
MSRGADRVKATWHPARRVLAVRTDNLGDVLMTTPALAALKATLRCHLTLLASPAGTAAVPHLPCVDDAIAVRAPWSKQARPDALDAIVRRVREGRFDAGVIFTTCTQSALPAATVLALAGVPLRLAHARENPYALLTDWVRDDAPPFREHEVERQLSLVRAIGVAAPLPRLRFALRRDDAVAARARLQAAGVLPARPYVALHAGASAPSRRYAPERFGAAAARIAAVGALPVVVLGSEEDRGTVEAVVRAAASVDVRPLAGALSLGELAAVIAESRLLVCNNSGPAHLAAALRTPVVQLYALTNPQHTPWGTPARVLNRDVPCRNCLKSVCPQPVHACLDVAPGAVADAAIELLTGVRPAAPVAELRRAA